MLFVRQIISFCPRGSLSICTVRLTRTDSSLNRLVSAIMPWLRPTFRKMRRDHPIDKIDLMRYVVVFLFGGVYIDADQVKVNGDLFLLFDQCPSQGLAASVDPSVIASTPRHPALLQMIIWIMSRADKGLYGARHDLTGPEGWRRSLGAYRRCEDSGVGSTVGAISADDDTYSRGVGVGQPGNETRALQARWRTFLFNAVQCGCWGGEVLTAAADAADSAERDIEKRWKMATIPGTKAPQNWTSWALKSRGIPTFISMNRLIHDRTVEIRVDETRLTQDLTLASGRGVASSRNPLVHDPAIGPWLRRSLACIGFHRCSKIYGSGPKDWPGGMDLG